MRDLILVTAVGICALVALGRPTFGMFVFVCLGFLNPHSMTWGFGRTLPLSQFVAIGTIVGWPFSSEPKRLPIQRETIIFLTLWGAFGISTLFALDRALEYFIMVSKILLMVLLSTILINSRHRLQVLIRVIALSLGFYAVKGGLFVLATGGTQIVYGPEPSFLLGNNSLGLALAMNVPLLFYLWKTESNPWLRRIVISMIVLSYPATLGTYSRAAWIGLAVATALMTLRSKYRVQLILAVCFLGLLATPLLEHLVPDRAADRYDLLVNYDEDPSVQSRIWNLEFCKRVAIANPLIGAGFDFYSLDAYRTYYPEFLERWPGKVWSCHNTWATIAAEHGALGVVLWIGLLASCFVSLRDIRRHSRRRPEMSGLVFLADAVQTSIIVFMIVGTFFDAAYFDMYYYLVASVIITKESLRGALDSVQVAREASDERAGV